MSFISRDGGITTYQTNGDDLAYVIGTSILVILVILVVITVLIIAIRIIRKQNRVHKDQFKLFEKKTSWRATKVIYSIAILVTILILSLASDYYGHYPTLPYGILLAIVAYPLFMLVRRIAFYISGVDYANPDNKK